MRNNHIVHLETDSCYVQDKVTGEVLPVIHEADDTFSMEFNVVPKAELNAIFQRAGLETIRADIKRTGSETTRAGSRPAGLETIREGNSSGARRERAGVVSGSKSSGGRRLGYRP